MVAWFCFPAQCPTCAVVGTTTVLTAPGKYAAARIDLFAKETVSAPKECLDTLLQKMSGGRKGTVVFDRGGWSPKLFTQMIEGGWHVLTYRKNKPRKPWSSTWHISRISFSAWAGNGMPW